MDQYALSYVCLATLFVGWSMCKYMLKRWGTHDHLKDLSRSLQAIQQRLESTRIDGVCLCYACVKASESQASRRASMIQVVVAEQKSEAVENAS
jgi:hypothetical protein